MSYLKTSIFLIGILFVCQNVDSEVESKDNEKQTLQNPLTANPDFLWNWNETLGRIPSVKDGEEILKEKCEKNGVNGSYETAMAAKEEVKQCLKSILNFTELPRKIQDAKPTGDLDLVFNEYCEHTDQLKQCINTFLSKVEPCLPENEKSSKYTIQNITEAILKFVCDEKGDYIALFIAEHGPECIMSKQVEIERCLKTSLAGKLGNTTTETDSIFSFTFDLEHCRIAYQMRKCITKELTCGGRPTSANVVDSIFRLVQRSTACAQYSNSELDPDDKSNAKRKTYSIISLIVPLLTVFAVRLISS